MIIQKGWNIPALMEQAREHRRKIEKNLEKVQASLEEGWGEMGELSPVGERD